MLESLVNCNDLLACSRNAARTVNASEETLGGDIFIHVRPMHSDTATDQAPVTSLLRRGIAEPREHANGTMRVDLT